MTILHGGSIARRLAVLSLCTGLAGGFGVPSASAAQSTPLSAQEWWLHGTLDYAGAWTSTEGDGVTVAVLGPAIDPAQADLAGSLLPASAFPADAPHLDQNPVTVACYGTQAATLIAGHGHPNRNVAGGIDGVFGIAPHARILPITVARDSNALLEANYMAMAIRSAVDGGAKVIDIASPGADGPELTSAVNYALSKGAIVVAPQGDKTFTAGKASAPADIPGVLAVTAVDEQSSIAPFATGAGKASVAAPGVDMTAGNLGNHYAAKHQGTGCAAALVAGEAALVLSQNPTWTSGQVIRVILNTASGHGAKLPGQVGYGVVDVTAAVNAAKPADSSNPLGGPLGAKPPAPAASSGGGGGTLVIVLIAVGALVLIGLVFLLLRILGRRRRRYVLPEPAPYFAAGPMELSTGSYQQAGYGYTDPQDPYSSGSWAVPAPLTEQEQQAQPPMQPQPPLEQQALPQPEHGYEDPYRGAYPPEAYGYSGYQSGEHYPQLPPQQESYEQHQQGQQEQHPAQQHVPEQHAPEQQVSEQQVPEPHATGQQPQEQHREE